jgi:hypothetical protein
LARCPLAPRSHQHHRQIFYPDLVIYIPNWICWHHRGRIPLHLICRKTCRARCTKMAKRVRKVRRVCNRQIVPTFCNSCSYGLKIHLLWSLSASLPHRGSRPLHSSILRTCFGVLVQEVIERGLECKLLVPSFIHFPFAGFRTSRLDHQRSPILMQGGLTISGGGLTSSGVVGPWHCVTCGVPP